MKTKTMHQTPRQLLAALLTLAILLPLFCFPAQTANAASSITLQNGEYGLTLHDDRNKCLNIQYASRTIDKKGVVVVDNWNRESNEIFIITNRGGGYVTISPKHASNLCLNALLANKTPGDLLAMHNYEANDAASLWLPLLNDDGSISFKNKATGLLMDVKDGVYNVGQPVLSWTSNNYLRSQGFYLDLISGAPATASISNGDYALLLHDNRGLCANVQYAAKTIDKANSLVVDNWNSESNEIFTITNRGSGYVSISPKHAPNLCINSLLASPVPGAVVCLHQYEGGDDASLWAPVGNGDGSVSFRNKATGYFLDVKNGGYSIGQPIISWHGNGFLRAQGYYLQSVSGQSSGGGSSSPSSSSSSAEAKITSRLNDMMSGSYGGGAYRLNTRYTGAYASEQCKGFAKKVHMILFGYNIGSTKGKPNNYQISYSSSNSRLVGSLTGLSGKSNSTVQGLFSQARPGDFIQLRRSHGGSHSMIFLSSNANGVTVYECNVDGRNGIERNTYSWSSFRSANNSVSVYTSKDYRLH